MNEVYQAEFDFLSIVYRRLLNQFSDEVYLGRLIEKRELNKYLALQFSLDRKLIWKLLKALEYRYQDVSLSCRGIKIEN